MPSQRVSKVIIDTNLWISFLIGKNLQNLKDLIVQERIRLVTTEQLLDELKIVTSRPKLRKHFHQGQVSDLLALLEIISDKFKIKKIEATCRDPKDDFLLALAKESKADYLVTGDKDLLEIDTYSKTRIISIKTFKEQFS